MLTVAELSAPALFVAGLAASPHCGLMCGPVQAHALRLHDALPVRQGTVLLHGGRLLGYASLGAAAGFAGARLFAWLPQTVIGSATQLLAAVAVVGVGIWQLWRAAPKAACPAHLPATRLARGPAALRLLACGAAWAMIPCGLLYAVLFLAATSGSAASGALLLAAFGLGTMPLTGVGGAMLERARRARGATLQRAAALIMIVAGLAGTVTVLAQDAGVAGWCSGLLH